MALIGWIGSGDLEAKKHQLERLESAGCARIFYSELNSFDDLLGALAWGDTLVVVRFETLGSRLGEVLERIARIHEECCYIRSLEQGMDSGTNDHESKLLIRLLGVFAEIDRNLQGTEVGTVPGRVITKGKGGRKPVISEVIKQEIIKAVNDGQSQYSQAKKYGISRTSVLRIMRGEQ